MNKQDKVLQAKCQNIINDYGTVLRNVVDEIMKETELPIIGDTADLIALEYKRREGIRYGSEQVLRKILDQSNER